MKPLFVVLAGLVSLLPSVLAEGPRALPLGQLPKDKRLVPLRTLDDYFPFTKIDTQEAWAKRAEALRRRLLVSNGLWPMPSKAPLQAVIHGKVEREDYTVEKVYFPSMPGHFVTGSLYRPKNAATKAPAVLCPHGHWANGRFHAHTDAEFKKELETKAEEFDSGRHPLQARCVNLARMGCVVFHYDMIGYADSVQIEHRPGFRENMNTAADWGFFSPQAELRLQNMMGLQTYNSIRALDFLLSLPGVDATRIGVTGASGGGTQTFMLGGIDDRPSALFPAVMVSTGMQGGCTCENAPYLRINGGNIDIAALAAPRPLGMSAADDWTKEMETKGYPDLKAHYAMMGVPEKVKLFPFLQYGHNYNSVSRHAMYGWFNEHLLPEKRASVAERPFKPLTTEELSVWNAEHPKPKTIGDAHEREVLKWWAQDAEKQLADMESRLETDPKALAQYRATIGGGWKTIIGRELSEVGPVEFELVEKVNQGDLTVMSGLLNVSKHGEQVPALFLYPGEQRWNKESVVWIDESGKSGMVDNPEAKALAAKGYAVMGLDLFLTGEFLREKADGQPIGHYGKGSEAWQKAACYTFGYNPPLFSRRIHDLLSGISFVQNNPQWKSQKIHLVGPARLVAAAAMQAGEALSKLVAREADFRFGQSQSFGETNFVPGSVKYRDLPGLLAMCAPAKILLGVQNEASVAIPRQVYVASKASENLVWTNAVGENEILAWLGN